MLGRDRGSAALAAASLRSNANQQRVSLHRTTVILSLCIAWLRTLYVISATWSSLLTRKQSDETLSLLTRLSQKPGVQSTLILSRETGAIVRTSGLISKTSSANPNSTLPASNESTADGYSNGRKESGIHSAEDVASLVWSFLKSAGSLVDELDNEDEVKLLRLRTKKNELVIIPGMWRCSSSSLVPR
jgi:dynein light chain roadblock-type